MPSRILPSLLSSFFASLSSSPQPSSSSSAAALAPALALYPSTITFAPALPGTAAGLEWRGQLVPLFNLVLGLVVFLFLVEERCVPPPSFLSSLVAEEEEG